MARYIDADALKADILKKYKQNWEVPCSYEDRIIQRVVTDLRVLIEQNIPADVAPKSEVAMEIVEIINDRIDNIRARTPYGGRAQGKTLALEKMRLLESLKVEIAKKYTEGDGK